MGIGGTAGGREEGEEVGRVGEVLGRWGAGSGGQETILWICGQGQHKSYCDQFSDEI